MDWELISFIKRSEQRQIILKALESPKTPKEISKATKLAPSHISRTLKEFMEKDIVKCLTPKQKTGRIYQLTEKGSKLVSSLAKD